MKHSQQTKPGILERTLGVRTPLAGNHFLDSDFINHIFPPSQGETEPEHQIKTSINSDLARSTKTDARKPEDKTNHHSNIIPGGKKEMRLIRSL